MLRRSFHFLCKRHAFVAPLHAKGLRAGGPVVFLSIQLCNNCTTEACCSIFHSSSWVENEKGLWVLVDCSANKGSLIHKKELLLSSWDCSYRLLKYLIEPFCLCVLVIFITCNRQNIMWYSHFQSSLANFRVWPLCSSWHSPFFQQEFFIVFCFLQLIVSIQNKADFILNVDIIVVER